MESKLSKSAAAAEARLRPFKSGFVAISPDSPQVRYGIISNNDHLYLMSRDNMVVRVHGPRHKLNIASALHTTLTDLCNRYYSGVLSPETFVESAKLHSALAALRSSSIPTPKE